MPLLDDNAWREIGMAVKQSGGSAATLRNLAQVNQQLHEIFGNYRFVDTREELNAALAWPGETKAIVLMPSVGESVVIDRIPAATSEGKPAPILLYGETTSAVPDGKTDLVWVEAKGNAEITVSNGGVTASGSAIVHATGLSFVRAESGSTVYASGKSWILARDGSTVHASEEVRVEAEGGVTVTGNGSGIVFFRHEPETGVTTVDDETTIRRIPAGQALNTYDIATLEAMYPAPAVAADRTTEAQAQPSAQAPASQQALVDQDVLVPEQQAAVPDPNVDLEQETADQPQDADTGDDATGR